MKYALFTLLLACGDKDDDTAVEETEEEVVEETEEETEDTSVEEVTEE